MKKGKENKVSCFDVKDININSTNLMVIIMMVRKDDEDYEKQKENEGGV